MNEWTIEKIIPQKRKKPPLYVKRLDEKAALPRRKTDGSAGYDLCSISWVTLYPGDIKVIHTGIAVEILPGHYGHLTARSSLGKIGIRVSGGCSVIDEDYRGEVLIYLTNDGIYPYEIKPGHWVAQMVIQEYTDCEVIEADDLTETERGKGGFGSTGK